MARERRAKTMQSTGEKPNTNDTTPIESVVFESILRCSLNGAQNFTYQKVQSDCKLADDQVRTVIKSLLEKRIVTNKKKSKATHLSGQLMVIDAGWTPKRVQFGETDVVEGTTDELIKTDNEEEQNSAPEEFGEPLRNSTPHGNQPLSKFSKKTTRKMQQQQPIIEETDEEEEHPTPIFEPQLKKIKTGHVVHENSSDEEANKENLAPKRSKKTRSRKDNVPSKRAEQAKLLRAQIDNIKSNISTSEEEASAPVKALPRGKKSTKADQEEPEYPSIEDPLPEEESKPLVVVRSKKSSKKPKKPVMAAEVTTEDQVRHHSHKSFKLHYIKLFSRFAHRKYSLVLIRCP